MKVYKAASRRRLHISIAYKKIMDIVEQKKEYVGLSRIKA